jgi:hypothetical protein
VPNARLITQSMRHTRLVLQKASMRQCGSRKDAHLSFRYSGTLTFQIAAIALTVRRELLSRQLTIRPMRHAFGAIM